MDKPNKKRKLDDTSERIRSEFRKYKNNNNKSFYLESCVLEVKNDNNDDNNAKDVIFTTKCKEAKIKCPDFSEVNRLNMFKPNTHYVFVFGDAIDYQHMLFAVETKDRDHRTQTYQEFLTCFEQILFEENSVYMFGTLFINGNNEMTFRIDPESSFDFSEDSNTTILFKEYVTHHYSPTSIHTETIGTPDVFESRDFFAIGDIHGDYNLVVKLLTEVVQCAKRTLDEKTQTSVWTWTGKSKMVVFTGDLIDNYRPKCGYAEWCEKIHKTKDSEMPDELKILMLLSHLNDLADREGGRVIRLLGNHEILNFQNDVETVRCYTAGNINLCETQKESDLYVSSRLREFKGPDGKFYKHLINSSHSSNPMFLCVVKIGSYILSHGGITYDLQNAAKIIVQNSKNLNTTEKEDYLEVFNSSASFVQFINTQLNISITNKHKKTTFGRLFFEPSSGEKSVVWARQWGGTTEKTKCDTLDKMFPNEKIKMIVGHTPQIDRGVFFGKESAFVPSQLKKKKKRYILSGPLVKVSKDKWKNHQDYFPVGINSDCDGRVWRIDVTMSRAFDDKNAVPYFNHGFYGSRFPQAIFVKHQNDNDSKTSNNSVSIIIAKTAVPRKDVTSIQEKKSIKAHLLYIHKKVNEM